MTPSIKFVVAAAAFALTTSAASANTIIFDPLAPGIDTVENSGDSVSIDLNQDGYDDIRLGIGIFFRTGGFIIGGNDSFRFSDGGPNGEDFPGFTAPYQVVSISTNLFGEGDVVDASTFGSATEFVDLFGSTGTGDVNVLPNVGDSAYFGFRIDIGTSFYAPVDGFLPSGFDSTPESFFGFLQVSHGSVLIGQAGYNNVSGQGALIGNPVVPPTAAIPLPAGAVLLLGALGGLGALRLRRSTQA